MAATGRAVAIVWKGFLAARSGGTEIDALVRIPIWPGTHLNRDVLIAARCAAVELLVIGIRAALLSK